MKGRGTLFSCVFSVERRWLLLLTLLSSEKLMPAETGELRPDKRELLMALSELVIRLLEIMPISEATKLLVLRVE